jgi:hypothetical protein
MLYSVKICVLTEEIHCYKQLQAGFVEAKTSSSEGREQQFFKI